jgi:hypothetical protein
MGLPEQSGGGMDEWRKARRARVKRFSMDGEWKYNSDFSGPECGKPDECYCQVLVALDEDMINRPGGDIRDH